MGKKKRFRFRPVKDECERLFLEEQTKKLSLLLLKRRQKDSKFSYYSWNRLLYYYSCLPQEILIELLDNITNADELHYLGLLSYKRNIKCSHEICKYLSKCWHVESRTMSLFARSRRKRYRLVAAGSKNTCLDDLRLLFRDKYKDIRLSAILNYHHRV